MRVVALAMHLLFSFAIVRVVVLTCTDIPGHPVAGVVQKLVGVVSFSKSDDLCARQLRRKFLS